MLNTMVMIGIMMIVATIRGVTRYWIGLTANVVSASICSVMRIEPSSVAMPEPARAVIMSAVNTGASSCASEMPTVAPTKRSWLKMRSAVIACCADDRAREEADQHDDGQRPDADELHLLEEQPQPERPAEQAARTRRTAAACARRSSSRMTADRRQRRVSSTPASVIRSLGGRRARRAPSTERWRHASPSRGAGRDRVDRRVPQDARDALRDAAQDLVADRARPARPDRRR